MYVWIWYADSGLWIRLVCLTSLHNWHSTAVVWWTQRYRLIDGGMYGMVWVIRQVWGLLAKFLHAPSITGQVTAGVGASPFHYLYLPTYYLITYDVVYGASYVPLHDYLRECSCRLQRVDQVSIVSNSSSPFKAGGLEFWTWLELETLLHKQYS